MPLPSNGMRAEPFWQRSPRRLLGFIIQGVPAAAATCCCCLIFLFLPRSVVVLCSLCSLSRFLRVAGSSLSITIISAFFFFFSAALSIIVCFRPLAVFLSCTAPSDRFPGAQEEGKQIITPVLPCAGSQVSSDSFWGNKNHPALSFPLVWLHTTRAPSFPRASPPNHFLLGRRPPSPGPPTA